MQQTHAVQAAIPAARAVLVVVAHVHLADIETMTRQESLRKEGVGQEALVVVAIPVSYTHLTLPTILRV